MPHHHGLSDRALEHLRRPLTGRQLADKLSCDIDACSSLLKRLREKELVRCLNPAMRRGRVYCRTDTDPGETDWALYGWVSFSHRRAVLKALDKPRQPANIKRRARYLNPDVKMSANNVRDVVYAYLKKGIVRPIYVRGKAHKRYELTKLGRDLFELMWEGET